MRPVNERLNFSVASQIRRPSEPYGKRFNEMSFTTPSSSWQEFRLIEG